MAVLGGADCEQIGSGWLAQPANAVSSLVFVGVGLWLLWCAHVSSSRRGALAAAGGAMVGVGIGSFAFHGPQPSWANTAHDVSIVVLAAVIVTDHAWLFVRRREGRAAALLRASRKAAPLMVLALAAYWAGRTASAVCRPASLWQYHAAWHALSAVALGLFAAAHVTIDSRHYRHPGWPRP